MENLGVVSDATQASIDAATHAPPAEQVEIEIVLFPDGEQSPETAKMFPTEKTRR
jgi:hypothetical protein